MTMAKTQTMPMPAKKVPGGKGGGNLPQGGTEPQPPGQQADEELPQEGDNPFAPAADAEQAAQAAGQEEVSMQQMMQFLVQQQQVQSTLLQHFVQSSKGKGKGSKGGGISFEDGAELPRTQMLKPETAPTFSGKGYEIWKKSLKEWEDLHYAVDEYQKPGLLMRALQGEALALARAELKAHGGGQARGGGRAATWDGRSPRVRVVRARHLR